MVTVLFAAALAALTPAAVPSVDAVRAGRPAPPVTWRIDATHSELTFRIRHLVGRVRGTASHSLR